VKKGRGLFLLKDRKMLKAKKKQENKENLADEYRKRRYG
jgi:hypothetical protein